MEGFDMSDVQRWVVGITNALDNLVPDERTILDLDTLRRCINDHVVRTVFPLTEDCVPETTRTLSLAVVADATFKPGKEAVLFDGTIFVNPEQYLLLRKTDSRVLSRHYWKWVNLDGDIDATYTIAFVAMVREELHIQLTLQLEFVFGAKCFYGRDPCELSRHNKVDVVAIENFCTAQTSIRCKCGKRMACAKHDAFSSTGTEMCYSCGAKRARTGDKE